MSARADEVIQRVAWLSQQVIGLDSWRSVTRNPPKLIQQGSKVRSLALPIAALASAFALSFAPSASAGTLVDEGSYVYDQSTGLDWLKLEYLSGYSYQQVASGALGYTTSGWSFATADQVTSLFSANVQGAGTPSGFYQEWSPEAFDSAYALVQMLGINVAFNDARATYDILQGDLHQVSSEGWISGGGLAEVTAVFGGAGADQAGRWGVAASWPYNGPDRCCSSYLVRTDEKTLAVPEPGTWALLMIGMAALGAIARRRRHLVA